MSLWLDVYTPAVAVYPVNRREAAHQPYPIGEEPEDYPPLLELQTYAADGVEPAELGIEVQTADHLLWSLNRSESWLRQNNKLVGPKVMADGVLQPITLVLLRVEHQDGETDRVLLASADGSSRTAWCHAYLGVRPEDVVYDLPDDERAYRALLGRVRQFQELAVESLTEEQRAQHRALVAPARIIIGWRPDTGAAPDGDADFREAVDSLVGLIHVDPPRPWDRGGQVDLYADAALRELLEHEVIDEDHYRWFAGMLTPTEAASLFTESPDARLLHLIAVLLNDQNKGVVSQGVRKVSSKSRLGASDRFDIVAELALRAVRHQMEPAELRGVRSALSRALRWQPFREKLDWEAIDYEPDLKGLRAAALRQVRRGATESEAVQLTALALYWLTTEKYLERERPKEPDYRATSVVLESMMVPRGVQLMYRVVAACRAGKEPALVDEAGQVVEDPIERTSLLSDPVIRRAFPGLGPGRRVSSGRGRYFEIQDELKRTVTQVSLLLNELVNVRDEAGRSLVRTERVPKQLVNALKDGLEMARDAIVRLDGRYGETPEPLLGIEFEAEDVEVTDDGDFSE